MSRVVWANRFRTNSAPVYALTSMALLSSAAYADFEEVRILRTEPVQMHVCPPPGQAVQAVPVAPAPQPQTSSAAPGVTGREILGGAAGAAVGGLLGNQVGSGSGRTAATVAGAGVGAYAGYKLAAAPTTTPPPQQLPPQQQQATAPQQHPSSAGISGTQILGGVAGAAVGGLAGNQVGSGSGRTAATVAGAGLGAYAGYKLTEQKPQQAPPPSSVAPINQQSCGLATYYRVHYARSNGLQGNVMMSSQPTGAALMINFCGDRPCN